MMHTDSLGTVAGLWDRTVTDGSNGLKSTERSSLNSLSRVISA